MKELTYKLTGDKGTAIEVVAVLNAHNVSIEIEYEVAACSHAAMYDAVTSNSGYDLVVGHCIDGNAEHGQVWDVAVESMGGVSNAGAELTHGHLAECPIYEEQFTIAKSTAAI